MSMEKSFQPYVVDQKKKIELPLLFREKKEKNFSPLGRHLWYLSPFRCCTCGIETSHGSTFAGNIGTARIRSSINQMHCNTGYDIKTLDSFIGPFSGFFFDALQLDTSFFE